MTEKYIPNPLVDVVVVLHENDDEPVHIDISSYSKTRGFEKVRLSRAEAGFDVALRFLTRPHDTELSAMRLSVNEKLSLWEAGLIVRPQERGGAVAPRKFAVSPDEFNRQGFLLIPNCVTSAAAARLVDHYRDRIERGQIQRGDRLSDRYVAHNDAAGRVVQNALRGEVERIVGSPIQSSFTYTSLYCGGAALTAHTDRVQCKYTVSVVIDHHPVPEDGISPWPVQLFIGTDTQPVECFQPIGGALLFRGCQLSHGRPILPADEKCWVMLLHFVDSTFDGSLD